jgi:type 1 fimbriae regulatory protein FimB/type 1 fimbriae regulatory protein FimE
VCNLKWDSIDLARARIHVNRAKNGEPSTHPLSGVELRGPCGGSRGSHRIAFRVRFRAWLALHDGRLSQDDCAAGRGAPVQFPGAPVTCSATPAGTSWPMTGAIREPFSTTWATRHTVRYTKLSPDRFRDFWRD